MKQVIRKGLRDIIVDEVPDPELLPHHVLVRPIYSLISSGTETASIHRDSLLSEVADNTEHGEAILVGRNLAARMPEGVASEHACFATLVSIAMNAVRTARIELGDVV